MLTFGHIGLEDTIAIRSAAYQCFKDSNPGQWRNILDNFSRSMVYNNKGQTVGTRTRDFNTQFNKIEQQASGICYDCTCSFVDVY